MEAPSLTSRGFIKSGPKRLLGSSKNRSIPPLQTDDDLICDNFAKCELINDFFSEQSNLDDSNLTVIFPTYEFLDTCSNPWSVDVFSLNQLSVNESISWQEYSAEIISILDTILIRPDLHVGSLECIWLEIKLNNKKILVRHILYPTN
jgi:hypothetical protein